MRFALALSALVAAVSAQSSSGNYSSELDMKIDPNTVKPEDRVQWCRSQYNVCKTLCKDNFNSNDCSDTDLSYNCTCASNNSAPGLQYYTGTMPTFICQELLAQCIADNTQSQRDQDNCKTDIGSLCGTYTPPAAEDIPDDDGSTTTQAASATGASATEEAVSTTSSQALAAPTVIAAAGKGAFAVAVGVMAYML